MPEEDRMEMEKIKVCVEDWSFGQNTTLKKQHRLSYTIISVFFQYALPLLVICVVYYKIYNFLQERRLLNRLEKKKLKRTTSILLAISLLFCMSWLPFSVLCIITEIVDLYSNTGKSALLYSLSFQMMMYLRMQTFLKDSF